jgi:hypothetical protein
VSPNEFVKLSEHTLRDAVDRVMHVWSLIKLVPERHLPAARSSITALLHENAHLTEHELIVAGLKHLHDLGRLNCRSRNKTTAKVRDGDGKAKLPKRSSPPPYASAPKNAALSADPPISSDLLRGAFSDQRFLERLAESFSKSGRPT